MDRLLFSSKAIADMLFYLFIDMNSCRRKQAKTRASQLLSDVCLCVYILLFESLSFD